MKTNLEPLNIQPQDQAFYEQCREWLDASAREAGANKAVCYPVFFNEDGSLNRQRMLELPCYAESGIHLQPDSPVRLCHQCGTEHIIPEGAECLKAKPEVKRHILQIAMKAGITTEWVRENYIPIKRIIDSQERKW